MLSEKAYEHLKEILDKIQNSFDEAWSSLESRDDVDEAINEMYDYIEGLL